MPNIRVAVEHHASASARYIAMELPKSLNRKLDKLNPVEEAQLSAEWKKLFSRASTLFSETDD